MQHQSLTDSTPNTMYSMFLLYYIVVIIKLYFLALPKAGRASANYITNSKSDPIMILYHLVWRAGLAELITTCFKYRQITAALLCFLFNIIASDGSVVTRLQWDVSLHPSSLVLAVTPSSSCGARELRAGWIMIGLWVGLCGTVPPLHGSRGASPPSSVSPLISGLKNIMRQRKSLI